MHENNLIKLMNLMNLKTEHYLVTLIYLKSANNQINLKHIVNPIKLMNVMNLTYLICATCLINRINLINTANQKRKESNQIKESRKHLIVI